MTSPQRTHPKIITAEFFLFLDFIYSIILELLIGDLYLIILHLSALFLVYSLFHKYTLPFLIIIRFIAFSALYGMERSHVFLLICILWFEMTLQKWNYNKKIVVPLFLAFNVVCKMSRITCTLDVVTLNHINVLTRIYVLTYLFIRIVHFKFVSMKHEKKLAVTATELHEMEEDELSFLKRLSHFTRNALNGVGNCFSTFKEEFLQEPKRNALHSENEPNPLQLLDSEKLEVFFDTIEMSCSEINHQTSGLVEYFLIRSGKFSNQKLNEEVFDVRKVINFVVRVQKKLRLEGDEWKRGKVDVRVHIDKSVEETPSVVMDRFLFLRVVTNIVSNAIKYTDKGTVDVHLKISSSMPAKQAEDRRDGHDRDRTESEGDPRSSPSLLLVLRVVDTGVGISKEHQKRVFEAFVPNNTKKQGFSIGLVITHGIVEKLGGSIDIYSEGENMGTQAEVRIPIKTPTSLQLKNNQNQLSEQPFNFEPHHGPSFPIKNIVIAEDHRINLQIFRKQVEKYFQSSSSQYINKPLIHCFSDGLKCLEFLKMMKKNDPSDFPIILTDIDMPGLSGLELCRRAKSLSLFGNQVLVHAITATVLVDEDHHGFDGFTSKPVYPKNMNKILHSLLTKRHQLLQTSKKSNKNNNKKIPKSNNNNNSKIKKISIKKVGDEKKSFKDDVSLSLFTLTATWFSTLFCPSEFFTAWNNFNLLCFFCILAQYSIVLIFGINVQTNNIITLIRMFLNSLYASEFTVFSQVRTVYLQQITRVAHSSEFVESFPISFAISLIFYIYGLYYEVTRSRDYFLDPHPSGFLGGFDWVCFCFVMLYVVIVSQKIVKNTDKREKRWKKMIEEKTNLKKDYYLTLSKISHDLSTPASALLLYLEEMRQKVLNQKTIRKKSKFRGMYECALGLQMSIHNFLLCCKIKNGMIFANRSRSDVRMIEFVKEMLEKCMTLSRKKKFDFRVQPVFGKSLFCIDLDNIRVICLNLIINSIKHSHAKNITVLLDLDEDEGRGDMKRIVLSVVDDGVGISDEILRNLESVMKGDEEFRFQERFRNSLGLGLVMCVYLSKEIGGEIKFESSESQTIVKFSFPYYIIKKRKKRIINLIKKITEVERRKRRPCEMSVLCLDDSPILVKFMKKHSKTLGFGRIETTIREEVVIERLCERKEKFDVLISDFNLNRMNLLELLERIKPDERPGVVVCVTGSPDDVGEKGRGLIDGVVSKPMHLSSIKSVLERFVDFSVRQK